MRGTLDMVRIGLALCLLLATTPGSWRSCCLTNRIIASAVNSESDEACHDSCCANPANDPGGSPACEGTRADGPAAPPSACHCGDARPIDISAPKSAYAEPESNRRLERSPFAETVEFNSFVSWSDPLNSSRWFTGCTSTLFHSSDDVLYVFHILRC
jgi:hypothetical protein